MLSFQGTVWSILCGQKSFKLARQCYQLLCEYILANAHLPRVSRLSSKNTVTNLIPLIKNCKRFLRIEPAVSWLALRHTNCIVYGTRRFNASFTRPPVTPILSRIDPIPPIDSYFFKICLGGLGVTCSPRDPRFAGSNPAEVDGFFQVVNILSTNPPGGTLQ